MTIQTLDSSNMVEFLEKGTVAPIPALQEKPAEVKVEPEAKVETAAEPQDDPDEKDLPEKITKIIGKKHRAMMEAKEQAKEAESFAETQYRERRAAEKRAEELEAQLNERKSREAPPLEAKEPKREDFESDAAYWDAKIDWKAAEAVRKDRAARAEEQRTAEAQRLDSERIARNRAFAKTVPDYEETIEALATEDLNVPPHIAQYLLESDTSPALMYHFAKNTDEFKRIAALSPIKAIAAIGKLEASLEKPKTEAAAEVKVDPKADRTRAPAPITPIAGANGHANKDPAQMSPQEMGEYLQEKGVFRMSRRQRH